MAAFYWSGGGTCSALSQASSIVELVDRRLVSHREPLSIRVDGQLNRGELALHMGWALLLLKPERGEGVA